MKRVKIETRPKTTNRPLSTRMRLKRLQCLLFTGSVLWISVMLIQGCMMESSEEYPSDRTQALSYDTTHHYDDPNNEHYGTVEAGTLAPGLPGCRVALADPDITINEDFYLYRVVEAPGLGLLASSDEQICVSDFDALELWLTTGKWLHEDNEALMPTTYEGDPTGSGQDQTDSQNEQQLNKNGVYIEAGPNTTLNTGGSASSDPVDDSNPLPPRVNPLL